MVQFLLVSTLVLRSCIGPASCQLKSVVVHVSALRSRGSATIVSLSWLVVILFALNGIGLRARFVRMFC